MRRWTAGLVCCLAAGPLLAQDGPRRVVLDSGTVVRLAWPDGREKARLVAPLEPSSPDVRYCRYPSPVCGELTLNPPQARPVRDLTGIEVRRGSRTGRGALIGAGAGVLGGLAYLVGSAYGDRPAQSTGRRSRHRGGSGRRVERTGRAHRVRIGQLETVR